MRRTGILAGFSAGLLAVVCFVAFSGMYRALAQAQEGVKPHSWTRSRGSASRLPERNPDREAFYGETHVHTSWSFDAYVFGNHLTDPAEAYGYATGQPIKHPLGYEIKISAPLDWMGITDHSEYVGTVRLANQPGSFLSKLPIAQKLVVHNAADIQKIYLWLGKAMIDGRPIKELLVPEIAGTVWEENNQTAEQFNKPGKFTAFCSYEWTSTPDFRNMHRNVFFKDCAHVPEMPFSSIDSAHPEDLWNWIGSVVATGTLHAVSSGIGLIYRWPLGRISPRAAGAVVALAGATFLWRAIAPRGTL